MSNRQTSYYPVKNHIKQINTTQEIVINLEIRDCTVVYIFSHVDCRVTLNEDSNIAEGIYIQAEVPQYWAVRRQYNQIKVKAVEEIGNIEICECVI